MTFSRGNGGDLLMPKVYVKGKVKHFPYTKAGKKAAAKARKKGKR